MKGLKVRMMKRLLSSGLVAALIISMLSFSACGKDDMTAIAMRLFYAEGTVGLTDEAGSDKSLVENMNFYTGYHLKTGNDGQAKVSLDETRLVTLASDSLLGFEKKGEAMKLSLEEGELFFNVEEKLPESASLEIETSTMVVGIRGTSGGVKLEGDEVFAYCTDGVFEVSVAKHIESNSDDLSVADSISVEVCRQGELVTLTIENSDNGDNVDNGPIPRIRKSRIEVQDLPDIALREIQDSPNLAERCAKTYDTDASSLQSEANQILEERKEDKKDSEEKKSDTDKKAADETGGENDTTEGAATAGGNATANGNGTRNTQNRGNADRQANRGDITINGMTQEELDAANRQLALETANAQAQAEKEMEEKARQEEEKMKQEEAPVAEPAAAQTPSGPVNRTVFISVPSGCCIQFIDGRLSTGSNEMDYSEEVTRVSAKTFRGTRLPITYTTSEDIVVNPDGAAASTGSFVTSMQVSICLDGSTPLYLNDVSGAQQDFEPFGDGFYLATLGDGLGLRYNSATGAAELEMM